jgi:hypothetical protein
MHVAVRMAAIEQAESEVSPQKEDAWFSEFGSYQHKPVI